MMEDTGEDILRQRPSVVTTFFRRIGQVRKSDYGMNVGRGRLKHFFKYLGNYAQVGNNER